MGASQVISNRAPRIQFGPANQVGPEKGRQILINLNHIPIFQIDAKHNCQTCVETKLTRLSFQSVERHTEPLDLIHSDIYVISNLYKQYVVINILLPLLMITPSTVMCTYSKVRMRQ